MPNKNIDMFYPYLPESAQESVSSVLRGRWIGQGSLVDKFEDEIKNYINLPNVIAVNTSSSALRLALSIIGVKNGDEVISTPMTCTLTNHSILEQFAIPVFSDILPDSGNINPADIEKRITNKTKAIMCAHWGGAPCDLNEIHQIAKRHGLVVIEDASEAIGATYYGKPIGAISRFSAFSFQAIQILTTGEGGALVTTSQEDAELARIKRWYGIDRRRRQLNEIGYYDFDITAMGFGYHMTNISAAIGLESLKSMPVLLSHRHSITKRYREELSNVPGLSLMQVYDDRVSSDHFFTILVERRNEFCRKLREFGIETSIVHYRNDAYTIFGGMRKDLLGLEEFSSKYIALPTHIGLGDEDVQYITSTIKSGW